MISIRKFTVLVFLLCLVICLIEKSIAKKIDEEGLSKTLYTDSKGYFAIIPPAGWRIQEYPDDLRGKVAFIGPNGVDLRILASVKDFSSFEDLYQAALENAADIKNRFGANVSIQKTNFLGREAIKREFIYKGQKVLGIEFMDGNVRHDLQYSAPQHLYNKYLSVIMKSMETYKPLKKEEKISPYESAVANTLRLAQLFFEQGDYILAMQYVKEGLEIEPENAKLKELKAKIETAIKEQRGDIEVHKKRGAQYLLTGEYDRAIEEFTKAIQKNPNDYEAYTGRGFAYYKKDECDKATKDFERAIELAPQVVSDAYFHRGLCYVKKRQYEKAVEDFNKAINIKPDFAMAYFNRGICYRYKGEDDKAIADYTKAITIDPNYAEAYLNLGVIYLRKGEYRKAIKSFTDAITVKPDYSKAYVNRAVAYAEVGELEKAKADAQKAWDLGDIMGRELLKELSE